MTAGAIARQALRPQGIRSKPVRMPRVFDEPEQVLQQIRTMAPFSTILATFGGERAPATSPLWFFASLGSTPILHDPNWIAAARDAFDAEIVRPIRCALNLNPPSDASPPHLDMSSFRGFAAPDVPLWLLQVMANSRLFLDWLLPQASGIAWFWRGEGGELEYWADGPDAPPSAERPPMWNTGVMSDNEVMWHRVGAIGPSGLRTSYPGEVHRTARLHAEPAGWTVRNGDETLARFTEDEVRISIVWKGFVFKDEAHLASFEDKAYDLTLDTVVEIFRQDLSSRGLPSHLPADPLADRDWQVLLEDSYKTPFS